MTRVLLVYPYFRTRIDRSIFRFPPLGIAYVASSLRENGYDVRILDCTFLTREEALAEALRVPADVVGIYCMISMKPDCLRLARALRPHCRLMIAGGPLPSCDPLPFLGDFDVVVRGEGEQTVPELLRAWERGADLASVPGAVVRGNSGRDPVFAEERGLRPDLDAVSFPARDLLPNRDYIANGRKRFGRAATTVITTRGCPFRCEFCSNAVFSVSYRERSAKNVVDEVEDALSYGYDHIHFADDVFTLNADRVAGICGEIRRRGLSFTWECLGRVDSITPRLAALMKGAGCRRIFFGIESGNDAVLKLMNKKITVARARAAVEAAREAGIETGAFFILGYPGESDLTVLETIRFAASLSVDYLSFTVPYPLPGTALYERVRGLMTREWDPPENPLSDHVLTFHSDFSQAKLRFGILKGQVQFRLRRKLGTAGRLFASPFEKLSDRLFLALR